MYTNNEVKIGYACDMILITIPSWEDKSFILRLLYIIVNSITQKYEKLKINTLKLHSTLNRHKKKL